MTRAPVLLLVLAAGLAGCAVEPAADGATQAPGPSPTPSAPAPAPAAPQAPSPRPEPSAGAWRLPSPRSHAAAVDDGAGRTYVLGGMGANGTALDEVVVLDQATGATRVVGRLPHPLRNAPAVWHQGSAYLFGGYSVDGPVGAVVRVTPSPDGRSAQADVVGDLGEPIYNAGAATSGNGTVYLFGGVLGDARATVSDVLRYSLADGRAQREDEALPYAYHSMSALWVDDAEGGRALLLGGRSEACFLRDVVVYAPARGDAPARVEVRRNVLPDAQSGAPCGGRYSMGVAWIASEGVALLAGGYSGGYCPQSYRAEVYAYDPEADRLSSRGALPGRLTATAASWSPATDTVYVIGGAYCVAEGYPVATIQRFKA